MITISEKEKIEEMVKKAANGAVVIPGRALGPKPKYFLVGDGPGFKDILTGMAFTGILGEVLASALCTLKERYNADDKDCYITYLVKKDCAIRDVSNEEIDDVWLAVLQTEYQLSGCKMVVCLGKRARKYAALIEMKPRWVRDQEFLQYATDHEDSRAVDIEDHPETWKDKIRIFWEGLCRHH